MTENKDHRKLLEKFLNGTISESELPFLKEWLQTEEVPQEMKQLYENCWIETQDSTLAPEIQQRMFRHIKREIGEDFTIRSTRRVSLFRQWLKYAAVIALFIIGGISVFYTTKEYINREEGQKIYTVSAAKGQRASVVLPDGTKVWLNSHTELSYSGNYGNRERFVTLTGEAYFEVAKDQHTPFRLSAGEVEVEVLGTSFNIKAYKEDGVITTSLFSGKLKVLTQKEEMILEPDQCVVFSKAIDRLILGQMENPGYVRQWQQNKLVFDKETLGNIAVRLNRQYNIEVILESEDLKEYRFSGTIRNNSLDNVLEIISLSAPVFYRVEGDTIRLKRKE
ncbi:MAG: DUF4974 domain-containing protein [Tannerellaceae bacterium]|nr:DUF4974 domain-containing protein [Tannerellaceae bacterium]